MSHKCPECPKRFKSKSGRRRHINAQHPPDEAAPQHETVTEHQDAPDHLTLVAPSDKKSLQAALKALAIKPADVMSYRVYPDKVVIIEGPVGWKRVWTPQEE